MCCRITQLCRFYFIVDCVGTDCFCGEVVRFWGRHNSSASEYVMLYAWHGGVVVAAARASVSQSVMFLDCFGSHFTCCCIAAFCSHQYFADFISEINVVLSIWLSYCSTRLWLAELDVANMWTNTGWTRKDQSNLTKPGIANSVFATCQHRTYGLAAIYNDSIFVWGWILVSSFPLGPRTAYAAGAQ